MPEQLVMPTPQLRAQAPLVQSCPAGQTRSQAPQCALSLVRLRHDPAQFVNPAAHDTAQVPDAQTCPLAQTRLQAPQWLRSVWRSRHVPAQSL